MKKYATGEWTDFVLDGQSVGTLYRTVKRDKKGLHTMTASWGDARYSLSVDAPSTAVREKLWLTVRFRALEDLRGFSTNVGPREATRG
ncbi:MAG: hypothetical protein QM695_07065 [Micropruina sp.]